MITSSIPFICRLRQHVVGASAGLEALDRLAVRSSWTNKGGEIIVAGSTTRQIVSIGSGIAMRYRLLPDGGRQIIMFMFPGEACNVNLYSLSPFEDSLAAITNVRVDRINHDSILDVLRVEPAVNAGLWAVADEQSAIIRDQITSLGRCETRVRIAALLCDFTRRFRTSGGLAPNALPITQSLLADAVGVTHIHFNRVIGEFSRMNLVETRRGTLFIKDPGGLEDIARPLRSSAARH